MTEVHDAQTHGVAHERHSISHSQSPSRSRDSGISESISITGTDYNEDKGLDLEKDPDPIAVVNETSDPNIDGGYAWVICFACFLLNFSTWGMNSGFAIYFAYYLGNDTFPGATKMDYSYIGGIAFGVGLSFSPAINFIYGYIGTRNTIIIGNCLQFTALMLASWTTKLWQLYLTQGVMQSFGLAFISMPNLTILPSYFVKKRVFASSLATAGAGVGGICFNLGMQRVVESKSVFWALRVQSIIGFGLVWIGVALIRTPPTKKVVSFAPFDMSVFLTPSFFILALYVITCMFGYVIVLYTLSAFTTSLGYSEYQGSITSAMVQLGSTLGRPVFGFLADKYGAVTMVTAAYTVSGIFCLAMWIPARNYATVLIFALIMGSHMGSVYSSMSPILARTFGLSKMNVAFSMLWVLLGIAGIFSPVIGVKLTVGAAGGVINPTSYRYCAVFAGVSFVVCAISALVLRGVIIARDASDTEDTTNGLDFTRTKTPILESLKCCLLWPKRRV